MAMTEQDWNRKKRHYQKIHYQKTHPRKNATPYIIILLMFALTLALLPVIRAVASKLVIPNMPKIENIQVTISLIIMNCLVFILIKLNKLYVDDLWSSYRSICVNKEYYRVISAAFTHEDPLHIIFNMGSLYNLGVVLEPLFGSGALYILYVIIILIGGSFSVLVHKKKSPFTVSIGASGVICGLLGVYIVYAISIYGIVGFKSVIPTLVIMVLMTASNRIDNIGHFTGLATGLFCGYVMLNIGKYI